MATRPGPRRRTSGSRSPRRAGSRHRSPADRFMGVCHSPGHVQQPVKHGSPCSASGSRAVSQALTYETGASASRLSPSCVGIPDLRRNLLSADFAADRIGQGAGKNVRRRRVRGLRPEHRRGGEAACGVASRTSKCRLHRSRLNFAERGAFAYPGSVCYEVCVPPGGRPRHSAMLFWSLARRIRVVGHY